MEHKKLLPKLIVMAILGTVISLVSPVFAATTPTPLRTATPLVATPSASPTESPSPTPTAATSVMHIAPQIGTQFPWNKQIPVQISVTPEMSGQTLRIQWQSSSIFVISPASITIEDPQAGETYTQTFAITPQASGFQRAVANVILTTNDSNYVLSQDVTFTLSNDLVVTPQSPTYTTYFAGMIVAIILLVVLAILGARWLYFYIKNKLIPKWLEANMQAPQ